MEKERENKRTHPKGHSPKQQQPNHKKHRPTKATLRGTQREATRARKEQGEETHGSLPSKNGTRRNGTTHKGTRNKECGEKPTPTPKSP